MYIADDALRASFDRLLSSDPKAKKGLERTSALMYFLAFDALVSRVLASKTDVVDMNPSSANGQYNRNQFVAQYLNLVVISQSPAAHIHKLGSVTTEGARPDKRISANFLTTPLKRASQAAEPNEYPKRPSPLLVLGVAEGGSRWGVMRHTDWKANLASFLADSNSKTPFTDLAVVLSRRHKMPAKTHLDHTDLTNALKALFSDDLSDVWQKHLRIESKRAACPEISLQPSESRVLYPQAQSATTLNSRVGKISDRNRISYLERLLTQNGIPFDERLR